MKHREKAVSLTHHQPEVEMNEITQTEMVEDLLDELAMNARKVQELSKRMKNELEKFIESPWGAAYGASHMTQDQMDLQRVTATMQNQASTLRVLLAKEHGEFLNRAASGERFVGRDYHRAVSPETAGIA